MFREVKALTKRDVKMVTMLTFHMNLNFGRDIFQPMSLSPNHGSHVPDWVKEKLQKK